MARSNLEMTPSVVSLFGETRRMIFHRRRRICPTAYIKEIAKWMMDTT